MFVTRKAYDALRVERDKWEALYWKAMERTDVLLDKLERRATTSPKPIVPPEPTPEQRLVAHTTDVFAANLRADLKRERPDLTDAQLDAITASVRDEIGGFRVPVTGGGQ